MDQQPLVAETSGYRNRASASSPLESCWQLLCLPPPSDFPRGNDIWNILFLGPSGAGKTTIIKQLLKEHEPQVFEWMWQTRNSSPEVQGDRLESRPNRECENLIVAIKEVIKDSLLKLAAAMTLLRDPPVQFASPESDAYLEVVRNAEMIDFGDYLDFEQELYDAASLLFEDTGVRECLRRKDEIENLDLPPSAEHFLDAIPRIRDPLYVPSDEDVFYCRYKTRQIQDVLIGIPDHQVTMRLMDVSGQYEKRSELLNFFYRGDLTAIIFVCDCSGYNVPLEDEHPLNQDEEAEDIDFGIPADVQLREALRLFRTLWRIKPISRVPVMLFLNKLDLLIAKIHRYINSGADLNDIFPGIWNCTCDIPGTADAILWRVQNYILSKFLRLATDVTFPDGSQGRYRVRINRPVPLPEDLSADESGCCQFWSRNQPSNCSCRDPIIITEPTARQCTRPDEDRYLYPHFTTAIYADSIRTTFNNCRDMIRCEIRARQR